MPTALDGSSGVILSGSTSGTVTLSAPAVAGTTTITFPSSSGTVMTTAAGQTLTSPIITGTASLNGVNMTPYSMKNKIINGAMMIDQRNVGASVTIGTSAQVYTLDRWYGQGETSDGVFTLQQVSDAPNNFTNSIKATVTTADSSITSLQVYRFVQRIEGYNIADIGLGTSACTQFTISFWVKSSVTGTFGGSLWGAGATEWFVFSYTINAANTWEYKTVTVPARTTGSFNTTNGVGLQLQFSLGAGSSRLTTAGSWITTGVSEYYGVTGQTNLISTNGATWQITGVQLELGSVATGFEWRPFGTELELCQRYYQKSFNYSVAPSNGTSSFTTYYGIIAAYSTNAYASGHTKWVTTMRDSPTMTYYGNSSGYWAYNGTFHVNVTAGNTASDSGMYFSQQAVGGGAFIYGHYAASAEL